MSIQHLQMCVKPRYYHRSGSFVCKLLRSFAHLAKIALSCRFIEFRGLVTYLGLGSHGVFRQDSPESGKRSTCNFDRQRQTLLGENSTYGLLTVTVVLVSVR